MKKQTRARFPRSNVFLLEITLDILLFAVLMSVCLQMMLKARQLTVGTDNLSHAVIVCQNVADLYESGNGDYDLIQDVYTGSVVNDTQLTIYLNKDFVACDSSSAEYYINVVPVPDDQVDFRGQQVTITCRDLRLSDIYSITACHYTPLSPAGIDAADAEGTVSP